MTWMENKVFELKERKNSLTSCIVQGIDLVQSLNNWCPQHLQGRLIDFVDTSAHYHFPDYAMLRDFLEYKREKVIHVFTSKEEGSENKYEEITAYSVKGSSISPDTYGVFVEKKLKKLMYMINPDLFYNFNHGKYLVDYLENEGFRDKVGDLCDD